MKTLPLRTLLADLGRRKLGHWAIAYLAGAWLLLQVLDLLAQPFAWPALVLRAATVVLAVGFLAVLVIAWYHGERGAQRVSGVELLMLAGILVIAGAAVAIVGRGARGAGDAARLPAETTSPAVVAEQGSIAVLPFADLSPGHDQEYFSDGLTEELLNVLSQLPELRVISRTSAFAYKGSRLPLDSVARALRVAHVLEGSVRKSGERLRITAQLIDAASGYHLWSETYDRDLRDIFAVQDEIARAIVGALELRLGGDRTDEPLAREQTRDPEAHALLLRGLQLLRPYTRDGTARAIRCFQQAIELDPRYARAYAELGRVYGYQAYIGWGSRDSLVSEARGLARRALALDPDVAEAHYVLAFLASYFDWDFARAEFHFRKALELNPGGARLHSLYGWLLMTLGRPEDAIAESRRAVDLDPLDPGMIGNLATLYTAVGEYELARQSYDMELALSPDDAVGLANAAANYASLGRMADALASAEAALRHGPQEQYPLATQAYILGRAGRRAEAERAIRELEALPDPSPYLLANAWAGTGDADRVFALLERAVAEKDPMATDLGLDLVFQAYHKDPRMRRLLDRIGLP